jgi:hypothetical protein
MYSYPVVYWGNTNTTDLKKFMLKHIKVKCLKTKKRILKLEGNNALCIGENKMNDNRFLIGNKGGQKGSDTSFISYKTTVNPEFYI